MVGGRAPTAHIAAGAPHRDAGNVTTFVLREERVDHVARAPLADVAAMVSDTITAPAYNEHFQELVNQTT